MVTIIIPTYKRAQYIDRAINSILRQTYQDFEIIVVDDNDEDSQDRKAMEKKMLKYKYNNKIMYLKHKKNLNGAAARNTGIKYAHGEYITFLDDDDFFISDRLEKLTKILDEDKSYDAIYTGVVICINNKIDKIVPAEKCGNLQKEMLMKKFDIGTGSNLFFRKNVLMELNGFDESFIRHQDLEIMIRFFQEHKILNLNEYLVVKCNDDRRNTANVKKLMEVKEKYINQFIGLFKTEKEKQDFQEIQYLEILYLAIKNKNYNEFKRVKEKIGKIPLKQNLKFLQLFLLNHINMRPIKNKIKKRKLLGEIPENVLSEINKMNEIMKD